MPTSKPYFLKMHQQDQIDKVLQNIGGWSQICLHKEAELFKVQSLQKKSAHFSLTFAALNPLGGDCLLSFNIEHAIYQMSGQLIAENNTYTFTVKDLSQELSRRIPRIEIPKNLQAVFVVLQAAGQNLKQETQLKDIHTNGFLFSSDNTISIKAGDLIQGVIRIQSFDDIQVGGIIRHCLKTDRLVTAGIEIYHLEFGSEEKMAALNNKLISIAQGPQIR